MRHSVNKLYPYLEDGISFSSRPATELKTIYFPLCGIDSTGIKSAITPFLSGDIKIDSLRYLTKPVSTEDLRNNVRDFFCFIGGKGAFSIAPPSSKSGTRHGSGQFRACHRRERGTDARQRQKYFPQNNPVYTDVQPARFRQGAGE